jgi:hypothetical protein
MKKIILLASLFSFQAWSQTEKTLETHIAESVKPLTKLLEGKKGKVVLGTFRSGKGTDKCDPSKAVNSKIAATLARQGVPTVIASRPVSMDSEQAEISRVAKLTGGSYIVLGTYELNGTKFKIDCALYDHNGASIGGCDDVASVNLTPELAEPIQCPTAEKTPSAPPAVIADDKTESTTTDSKLKQIDDYICSIIHRDYDLKRLVTALYEKKLYSLDELKVITKEYSEDSLEQRQDNCVTLGTFVVCTNYWSGSGAQVFLSGGTALGATKISSWKHPNKALVKDANRCLKKDNGWWNP